MTPLLTIAIPNYNRAEMLSALICRIISLMRPDMADCVEIFVSDNDSDESVSSVVESIRNSNPTIQLRFSCNDVNIGFSRNFDKAIKGALGEFVFLMSNDDDISDDALDVVIDTIRSHPGIGLGFFASQTYDKDMNYPIDEFIPRSDEYYENGVDWVLNENSCVPCLISGWLVNRQKWISESREEWMSSNAVQVPIGMAILAKSSCYCHRSSPIVRYRADNGAWAQSNDPLCPYSGLNAYFHASRVVKDMYPVKIYKSIYMQTIRTTCAHTIRNKVLGIPIRLDAVEELLFPYYDFSWPNCLLTYILRILLRAPKWMLFVPFRWIVPK